MFKEEDCTFNVSRDHAKIIGQVLKGKFGMSIVFLSKNKGKNFRVKVIEGKERLKDFKKSEFFIQDKNLFTLPQKTKNVEPECFFDTSKRVLKVCSGV